MYQKVVIVGNLGMDPVMRYLPSGDPVTNFSVATNRRWTNSDGSQGEETVWFRVSVWNRKMAEACNQYLTKGQLVMVDGRLRSDPETGNPRIWTDQSGQPRASYDLHAYEVKFLGGRGDGGYSDSTGDAQEAPGITEDEIPF